MKKAFKIIMWIVLTITWPFIWLHRKYTKRKTEIKFINIVDGFANYTFPNKKVEALAKTRAEICSRCPFAKHSEVAKLVVVDNRTKEVHGMYCDICGCNLSAKVRSRDWCPKGKWIVFLPLIMHTIVQ
jgi:hypothetical protein